MEPRLGRYELVARLASGGMGEIFLGRLEGAAGFEKLYAIKCILPQFAQDARFRKMLIAEAQIASKMAHSNICQVYELGETGGQLYIVMEFLEGVTLLPLLRACSKQQTPLELGFIASVILQICDGLHYAHELRDRGGESLNVVHRDVTLGNVFVCENGTAKVLDFGIAKVKDTQATQTDTVKGKYAYMAPEQLRGGELTRQVDVFALGVVMYEMIALRRLFQRKTDYLTFRALLEEPVADIRRYRPELPEALVAVVMRALERDPAKRFETVRQLGTAIADGLGTIRPWPQETVGELVRTKFSDEREQRAAAVARAIERTNAGQPLSETPPIAATAAEEEEDDGFPAVEILPGPVTASPSMAPVTSPPSRRWIWITLVFVMLALGGVAMMIVMLQPAPPTEVIVGKTDAPTTESNKQALAPYMGALLQCAAKHPSIHATATATMLIGTDGRIKTVAFTPADLDASPLGKCLAAALRAVAFPTRHADSSFLLDLNLPAPRTRE